MAKSHHDPDTESATAPDLSVEYAIDVARNAGLSTEHIRTLGDILRRHAASPALLEVRGVILGLLSRYASVDQASRDEGDRLSRLG